MFQMNPLEIVTLVLMLLVVAGCIAVVVVAVRWLRSIGLQVEQDRTDRLERERADAEREAADAARRREDQDAQIELVKSQGEVAAAQAQLMKEQAGLAREQAELVRAQAELGRTQAEAAGSETRAHDARAVREAAEARRADAAATLAEAKTRLARTAAEREEVEVQRASAEADRAKAETQRAAVDEELSRTAARRAEAETRRADAETRRAEAQAEAVRDSFQGGGTGHPESADGRAGSGSPAEGRAGNPFGSAGGFLPAHGVGSGWNSSLADLSDVLGNWGGKAGKDAPTSGFPIDPRLLNLLPEDARKLLGGLKRPEDAEALFEWLRKRFGELPQNRRRGPGDSRRPTGFQPNDTGSEDSDGGDSGGVPADDASGRGSATTPAGMWGNDDPRAGRSDEAGRSDRSDPVDEDSPDEGVRPGGDPDSADGAEQVTDAGARRTGGPSWDAPWTGGIDVGALIEEALRERRSRLQARDTTHDEPPDHVGDESPNSEDGELSTREDDDSDGAADTSPDREDD